MDKGVLIGIGVASAFVALQYWVKQMPTPLAAAGFFAGIAIIAWAALPMTIRPQIGPFLLYTLALCAVAAGVAWQIDKPPIARAAQQTPPGTTVVAAPPNTPQPAQASPHVEVRAPHHRVAVPQATDPAALPIQNNYGGIITNNQTGGSNTIINPPPARDPLGIYQGANKIGRGQGGVVSADGKMIQFQALHFNDFTDPSHPLEYQGLLLECEGAPVPQPNVFVGQLSHMIVGASCRIVGRR